MLGQGADAQLHRIERIEPRRQIRGAGPLKDAAGARITDQIDLFPGRRGAGKIFHHGVQAGSINRGGDDSPPHQNSFEEFFPLLETRKTGPNYNGYTEGKIAITGGDWGEHR